MKVKSEKNGSYLQVCYALRKSLGLFSDEDGRLFPERVLCEQLSVSRATLRKALDELRCEGYINSEGRRNYISDYTRNRDIGILMDCYKPAPYIPSSPTISGIMAEMENADYNGRILVPREDSNISLMVKQYNLRGLLWIDPPELLLPTIVDMGVTNKIKVCSVLIHYENKVDSPLKSNYITLDRDSHGKERAEYFIRKGHQKVVYLGNADFTYNAFSKQMKAHGINLSPKWRLEQPAQIAEHLPKLIIKEKITGIVSNGGIAAVSMFKSLSQIEKIKAPAPDILLPYNNPIRELMKKYPNVKISKFGRLPEREYGSEGMKMLLRQIEENRDQAPVFVKSKFVTPEDI
jgi:DNA-binding LacI/PurR family transcriptional regulator